MSQQTDFATHLDSGAARVTRFAALAMFIGFGGFAAWSTLAPLPGGVAVPGVVSVSGSRKTVQATSAGVITHISVTEGDVVAQGDVLIRLDPTSVDAELRSVRARHMIARSAAARLRAELGWRSPLTTSAGQERGASRFDGLQQELLGHNVAAEMQTRRSVEADLTAAIQRLAATTSSLAYKRQQASISSEQLANMQQLMADGYLARNRWLEMQRTHLSVLLDVTQEQALHAQARSSVTQLQARLAESMHAGHSQRVAKLVDLEREMQSLESAMAAAEVSQHAASIRAPTAGTVVALGVHTQGGAVAPGQLLMEIVPAGSELEVHGRLPVDRVDEIKPGARVDLFFSAFDRDSTPKWAGTVARVSADRMLDERTGEPYYEIVIAAPHRREAEVGEPQIKPGMPVEIFVKTAERTLLGYLVKPLVDKGRIGWGQGS